MAAQVVEAAVHNASNILASPTADAVAPLLKAKAMGGVVGELLEGVNGWMIALTLLALAVAYDQCKWPLLSMRDSQKERDNGIG